MSDHITIQPTNSTWVVRAGGAVLGESNAALRLSESGHDAVIYFPKSDIAMDFLDVTEKTSTCPHKGTATYYSIVTKSTVLENAAWSYDAPLDGVIEIADHIAFYDRDEVAVEEL